MIRHGALARGRLTRWAPLAILVSAAVGAVASGLSLASSKDAPQPSLSSIHWPEGTEVAAFDNLDGVILLRATVTGADGRDTTGVFVLDTGAGFIALDEALAIRLGLAAGSAAGQIDFTRNALPRFQLGNLAMDQVQTLTFDAGIIRTITDQPVMGLIGHELMRDRALWIDYGEQRVALVPAGAPNSMQTSLDSSRGSSSDPSPSSLESSRRTVTDLVSAAAFPLPFRVAAGGKVLVRTKITPRRGDPTDWLTFVFDTGATKCALFTSAAELGAETAAWRPSLRALQAPTLMGRSAAQLVRAARVDVTGFEGTSRVTAPDVDVLIVDSALGDELSRVAGEPVSGLLGYSFLRRFRVVCDYPHRVLWLDPIPAYRDARPYEHSHAGIQLERQDGIVRVMSVARPSPGQRAGIQPGDEVVAIDRLQAVESSLSDLGRRMEGKPGTVFSLTIRRGGHETAYRLRRKRLL